MYILHIPETQHCCFIILTALLIHVHVVALTFKCFLASKDKHRKISEQDFTLSNSSIDLIYLLSEICCTIPNIRQTFSFFPKKETGLTLPRELKLFSKRHFIHIFSCTFFIRRIKMFNQFLQKFIRNFNLKIPANYEAF